MLRLSYVDFWNWPELLEVTDRNGIEVFHKLFGGSSERWLSHFIVKVSP